MQMKDWMYVAPQRIRAGRLALPKCERWEQHEELNLQRLARVFEFQGCIGFIGSGASVNLGYPRWDELLPQEPKAEVTPHPAHVSWEQIFAAAKLEGGEDSMKQLKALSKLVGKIDATQAIQIAQEILGDDGRKILVEHYLATRFFAGKQRNALRKKAKKYAGTESPFPELLKLPIRRFMTTNYDLEIEEQLKLALGLGVWKEGRSFEQDDANKIAIFAVALASANRNMVFHCHGTIARELHRLKKPAAERADSTMVLTDADYNHWYLSRRSQPFTFQRSMDVILQSNPLLFIGYSISDFDLLRILRQANLRRAPERIASNLFLLLGVEAERKACNCADCLAKASFDPMDCEEWKLAKQIKMGVNLLPFRVGTAAAADASGVARFTLATKLRDLAERCTKRRSDWLIQPKMKLRTQGPTGTIFPRRESSWASGADPLFGYTAQLNRKGQGDGRVVDEIAQAFRKEGHRVVALIGGAGSGKLLKACQYVDAARDQYEEIHIFHSYNNDDIYSYSKRIKEKLYPPSGGQMTDKPSLVVINNIDLLIGDEPCPTWRPRNKEAITFLEGIFRSSSRLADPASKPSQWPDVLLTARSLAYPMGPFRDGERRICQIYLDKRVSFKAAELMPKMYGKEFARLHWELQHENSGLVLATRYVAGGNRARRAERLSGILTALQANSSELGTRVVRHIIRHLDAPHGRIHETLLWFLSCFNTPLAIEIVKEVFACSTRHLSAPVAAPGKLDNHLQTFLSLGLLQEIGSIDSRNGPSRVPDDARWEEPNYIVPPLVKRYFREIMEKSPPVRETREYGLHGLLSRGPFNSPGCSSKPKLLFDHLVEYSFEKVKATIESRGDPKEQAVFGIRALLDLLRSNFACNSVPLWGHFRDYIDMLSITIDLLRNFAKATGAWWDPGKLGPQAEERTWEVQPTAGNEARAGSGVASAEEMLYLYNELGLAYYQTGSVQDALRVWGLASDWCKAVAKDDAEQGEMYHATLDSHLGAAYMQLGRMHTARECFEKALAAARTTQDPDLELRMKGMLARIDHFGGCVKDARSVYEEVIAGLGVLRNRRAQSYFLRHLAALEVRFGDLKKATTLANESMAIAANENAPDLMAFASEAKAKVHRVSRDEKSAMREYRIALVQAENLDIARLKIDILLGKADIQLSFGDVSAARSSALDALKLANEHLLVLRQAKALITLGNAASILGEIELAKGLLGHAKDLAKESLFRLTEHDAQEALAALGGTARR